VENEAWGVGPYLVYLRATGVTPLAQPMGSSDLLHLDWTTLPPPGAVCGLVPRPPDGTLTRDATDATGMTAAFTASYVPAGTSGYTVDWGDGTASPGLTRPHPGRRNGSPPVHQQRRPTGHGHRHHQRGAALRVGRHPTRRLNWAA
jgi:hypothetical protein